MQNKFFGSKLNIVILLIIIVVIILVLNFTDQNQKGYLPDLSSNKLENTEQGEVKINTEEFNQALISLDQGLLWRWGKFTLKLPLGWEARSADSGEGSALIVGKNNNGDFYTNSVVLIRSITNCDYDVPEREKPVGCITQQEFVDNMGNRSKLDGKLISQEQTTFLGRNAIKQVVAFNNNEFFRYYLEGFDYTYFTLPVNTEDSAILLSVLSSINLYPTSNELESARNTL